MEKPRIDDPLYARAKQAIAHGALTNSKRPESFVKGVYPTHLKKGLGCYVWDTNDNRYIDFICGLGSNLFGYAEENITKAVSDQLKQGAVLSLGTEIEVKAAERVKDFLPFVERLRFLKTGSEGCAAAVMIARAFTGRKHILSDAYHGWSQEFQSLTPPANGCIPPQYIGVLNNPYLLDGGIAAVIVEPVITDYSPERIAFLKELRDRCTAVGTLLIFDEVITGFRVPNYSIAQSIGVIPDLIIVGKAMAGGLPLAAVGGRSDIMESEYFVSSTFAGDTLALAASMKCMDMLQSTHSIDRLWVAGETFLTKFNEMGEGLISLKGYPTRSVFVAEPKTKALFFQECCRAGILVGPSFFFSFCHIELANEVLGIFKDIILRIKTGSVDLLGAMPQTPFAQKTRGEK